MTSALEARYRRLLRSYPSRWRAANGEVVLGTLLDVADAEGRDRPTAAERRTLVVDGLAHRLDRRVAVVSASTAFVAAVLGSVSFFLTLELSRLGLGWVGLVLQLLVVPIGVVVGTAALLRAGHRIGSVSAVVAVALAVPASAAALAAVLLWSVGFDAADAGRPVSGAETAIMLVSAATAWALAVVVIALLSRPLFRGGFATTVGGVLVAVVAAPFLGYGAISPGTGILLAAAVGVCALLDGRAGGVHVPADATGAQVAPAEGGAAVAQRSTADAQAAASSGDPAWLVPVLVASAVAGLASAGVALTGSLWFPSLDGTQAMGVGLGFGGLVGTVSVGAATVPLVRSRALPVLGAVAAALSPGIGGAGQLTTWASGADAWPMFVVASVVGGVGVSFLVGRALQRRSPALTPAARAAVAVLAGIGYAATIGLMAVLYAPFAAPVLAAVVAWRARRSQRAVRPAPGALAAGY